MKPVLCLDFDGVIVDSIDECLVIAYQAYRLTAGFPSEKLRLPEEIPERIVHRFRRNRHLVRPAHDYWALIELIVGGEETIGHELFLRTLLQNKSRVAAFGNIFYRQRWQMMAENPAQWLALHRLFSEFADAWDEVRATYDVHIVTHKDEPSLELLLSHFGIDLARQRWHTYPRMHSKKEAVREIAGAYGIDVSQIVFVDDNEDEVRELAAEGVQALLAAWGYSAPSREGHAMLNHLRELVG